MWLLQYSTQDANSSHNSERDGARSIVQTPRPQAQGERLNPSLNEGTPVQDRQHNAGPSVIPEPAPAGNVTQPPDAEARRVGLLCSLRTLLHSR